MRRLLLPLLIVAAACEPPLVPDDFTQPDAIAEVGGQVLKATGAPVTSGSVTIRCANDQFGGAGAIDGEGNYRASIGATREVLGGDSGSVPCVFTAPGGIRADRMITFGPPQLSPTMQVVNLRATS